MFLRNTIFAACFMTLLTGCGTIPASGPYGANMKQSDKVSIKLGAYNADNQKFRYAIADINSGLLNYLSKQDDAPEDVTNWPEKEAAEAITVNVGDTIQISIFESQSGGLFIPVDSGVRPGNFVSLPRQTIDQTGMISVPYAGEIVVAGKTPEEISKVIEERLSNKAIEPQVVVSFSDRSGAEVSVIGDVKESKRLSLGFNQYKILDAIASAGGPASPGYETKVSLQRQDAEYTIPFDNLVMSPDKNIYSKINDIIYLYREPQTFTAYGAVQSQGNIAFGKRNLLLSEALGLARGLSDTQADPAEIYVYRQKKYDYFTNEKTVDPVVKSNVKSKVKSFMEPRQAALSDEVVSPSFKMKSKVFTQGTVKKNKALPPRVKVAEKVDAPVVKELEDTKSLTAEDGQVSVIFKLDMRKPSSFFLAQNFEMQDQDVIYVANAESVEFLKFLNIISSSSTSKINTRNAF